MRSTSTMAVAHQSPTAAFVRERRHVIQREAGVTGMIRSACTTISKTKLAISSKTGTLPISAETGNASLVAQPQAQRRAIAKASYPPLDKFLYHPDSSSGRLVATSPPAARGRVIIATATSLGASARACITRCAKPRWPKAWSFSSRAEKHVRLCLDSTGRVIGIRIERFADETARRKHSQLVAKANKWMSITSTFPGSRITTVIGYRYLKKARNQPIIAAACGCAARKGVVLSAGGFICQP